MEKVLEEMECQPRQLEQVASIYIKAGIKKKVKNVPTQATCSEFFYRSGTGRPNAFPYCYWDIRENLQAVVRRVKKAVQQRWANKPKGARNGDAASDERAPAAMIDPQCVRRVKPAVLF